MLKIRLKRLGCKKAPAYRIIVINSTTKRSVRRNRLKRLMRESYRLLLKEGNVGISQNYLSLIFVGFEKALDKDFKQMKNIVSALLGKIKEQRG